VERPWKHLLKITDYTERKLFFSSTRSTLVMEKILPSGRQDGFMEDLPKIWHQVSTTQLDSNTDMSILNSGISIGSKI
jgi:hypothetical protein